MNHLRNLPIQNPQDLAKLIDIRPGKVVSMSLSNSEHCGMSLLSFADGEGVSDEKYFGDTLYYVLEGEMLLVMDKRQMVIKKGECICVPAGILHAIGGTSSFKIFQITVE